MTQIPERTIPMTRIALTTALALSLAAPAFANDQLAASLGVDAGDYSVAELIQLRSALENDDHSHVAFLLNGGDEQVSTQSFGEPEHVAIARALVGFTDSENE
ncbi:hypothetical protein [Rhodophyticola porphyridii]|uniref:hypothetical protein n=1 Tax=Rhodophyticola porphyridii TaxID=1852017 RepID=UPI0035CF34A0